MIGTIELQFSFLIFYYYFLFDILLLLFVSILDILLLWIYKAFINILYYKFWNFS